jgi:thiamine-monophosphate kinase
MAITVDTMVEGIHFLPDVAPASLGHKILAVNLSDLAAMGAKPHWASLALTLPQADESWLAEFTRGFFALADRYDVELIGGDTTRGPLTLTVQALGSLPKGQALRRSGAEGGDLIYLTGELGSAGLGLRIRLKQTHIEAPLAISRLETPEPRVDLGVKLRGWASACIDVTDGLAADLGHILEASGVGAEIVWEQLPFSEDVRQYIEQTGDWRMPLAAGDDYELCFTIPPFREEALQQRLADGDVTITRIGRITEQPGLLLQRNGQTSTLARTGYDHFTHSPT